MDNTSDTQIFAAINDAVSKQKTPTIDYKLKIHPRVSELFQILRGDLRDVASIPISNSSVLKHLLYFWFDMVNHYGCDRERLAEYIHNIMMKNRQPVMERQYKHFSRESLNKPQTDETSTTRDITKQASDTISESA